MAGDAVQQAVEVVGGARTRWPALTSVSVRYHGVFADVNGNPSDGTTLPLCRLR